MKSLFEYLKLLAGRPFPVDELLNFQRYWKENNPNFKMPDIATLKRVYSYCDVDVFYDDENYYVIDAEDNCIEMCNSFAEIKSELKERKPILIM